MVSILHEREIVFGDHVDELDTNDCFSYPWWDELIEEVLEVYKPIVSSVAFSRLVRTSFLGILSPKYWKHGPPLLAELATRRRMMDVSEGSRADHSIGVAVLILNIVRKLNLSPQTEKYAVIWALTHDIATWPLSHTAEPAMEKITGSNHNWLRNSILFGNPEIPQELWLNDAIEELGISINQVQKLFQKSMDPQLGSELKLLWQVIHSPLTPDSLEGIWRAGKIFGIRVPRPDRIAQQFVRTLFGLSLQHETDRAYKFWEKKSELYRKYINHHEIVNWESDFAIALEKYCAKEHMDLWASFFIDESQLVSEVLKFYESDNRTYKYKPPLEYFVEFRQTPMAGRELFLEEIGQQLKKKPKAHLH